MVKKTRIEKQVPGPSLFRKPRDKKSGRVLVPTEYKKRESKSLLKNAQKRYDEFIEKGKHKLGFYRPDVKDSDRFLMSFLIYFMVLIMVVFVADYLAQKVYEDSNSLEPLQEAEVEIVYRVQKDYFNMPVYLNRTSKTLWYDTTVEWRGRTLSKDDQIGGFGLTIDSVCTGFHEMVFLSVLVLGFRGVPVRLRIKWFIILDIIVFIENLFRIFALYPMALYWGRQFEDRFHFYWWHYGQYVFIMCLFGLWFFFVARKYVNAEEYTRSLEAKEEANHQGEGKGKLEYVKDSDVLKDIENIKKNGKDIELEKSKIEKEGKDIQNIEKEEKDIENIENTENT